MTQNHCTCPQCGAQLDIVPRGIREHSPLTPWTPLGELQNVSQGPLPGQAGPTYGEWQKLTPIGRLSARDVGTTLLDSLIVFGLVSAPIGLICHLSEITWLVGPSVGLFVAAARYLSGMANTQNLLTIREMWSSLAPEISSSRSLEQQEHLITVQIQNEKRWEFAYFKIEPHKLAGLAGAILSGAGFTEREASKQGITQDELRNLREEFINRGLARWNHPGRPQQGVGITRSGKLVLEAIVSTQQQAAADQED